jgi:diketogulonate reductase-like aldo/keto reductase
MHSVTANGAAIPAIGFGTWTLKGDDCASLVAKALADGYRHIDTARMYDNEDAVGEGIAGSGIARNDIFVTTKVWHTDLEPEALKRSAEESLSRLRLSQVDLLLIHWPNERVPLRDTMNALNDVRDAGLTRHIGVSNFPIRLVSEAQSLSRNPIVCNQVECHPYLDQTRLAAALKEAGMALVAYCPIYRGGKLFSEPAIATTAARAGKTPAQIVLRWHVQHGHVAIPRTSNSARLAENRSVFDFSLTDTEMAAIDALRTRNYRLCDYGFSPVWD